MENRKLYPVREMSNLRDLLNSSAELFSTNTAFKIKIDKENLIYKNITYTDFKNDVNALGTALIDLGLKDSTINVIADNRYEWGVSYLATVCGTGIIAPLDRALTNTEIKSLVHRSYASAIIFEKEYLSTILELMEEKTSGLKYYICMDKIDNPNIMYFGDLIEKGTELLNSGNLDFINAHIDNEKMSIMLFTSGTTAQSKAVMLSHKNITSDLRDCMSCMPIYQTDVVLSFLPLHHTFECTAGFLFMIANGACIVYCDGLKHIAKNLKEYGVSIMVCVPILFENMYKKLVQGIKDKGKWDMVQTVIKACNTLENFGITTHLIRRTFFKSIFENLSPNLRLFVSGAAAIDIDTEKGFNDLGIEFLQGYGLTETSPVVALETTDYYKLGSVGKPLPSCEIKIEDPNEYGIGEIVVKSPYVMLGYFEDPTSTAEVLKDNWFYTGDLGYLDNDGYLFIRGRKKSVIVLKNGKNIFPEELETLINKIPYVAESMVFGKPAKNDDLDIWAKIVYNKETCLEILKTDDAEEISKHLHEEIKLINKDIPTYKYIRNFILTDVELIKTTTRKIKRHEEMKSIKF